MNVKLLFEVYRKLRGKQLLIKDDILIYLTIYYEAL